MTHELKTHFPYFQMIKRGQKRFIIRRNDRNYQVGDELLLKEYLPEIQKFTGEELKVTVTYILDGGQFGIEKGYCIMSIRIN